MCFRAESLIFDMNSISIRALFIANCCKGDLNATEITPINISKGLLLLVLFAYWISKQWFTSVMLLPVLLLLLTFETIQCVRT